MRVPKIDKMLF